jgi:hypothetical protein
MRTGVTALNVRMSPIRVTSMSIGGTLPTFCCGLSLVASENEGGAG